LFTLVLPLFHCCSLNTRDFAPFGYHYTPFRRSRLTFCPTLFVFTLRSAAYGAPDCHTLPFCPLCYRLTPDGRRLQRTLLPPTTFLPTVVAFTLLPFAALVACRLLRWLIPTYVLLRFTFWLPPRSTVTCLFLVTGLLRVYVLRDYRYLRTRYRVTHTADTTFTDYACRYSLFDS